MRQQIGGIMTETRYSGMNTLDEPVIETIVRPLSLCLQPSCPLTPPLELPS